MWNNNIQRVEKCRNNYKELALIIYRQGKQIQFLETKALHLAITYVASQLAIFLSNLNPSAYLCGNWWKPFSVSISIAVVFGLNFATTVLKYMQMKYEQERNFIDQQVNFRQMFYLETHGESKKDGMDMSETYVEQGQYEPDRWGVYQRYAHVSVTASGLLAFTILVLDTCRSNCAAGV